MFSNFLLVLYSNLTGVIGWIEEIIFEFINPGYGFFYSLLPFMFIPLAFFILKLIIFYFKRVFY